MLKSDSIERLAASLVLAVAEVENASKTAENLAFKQGNRVSRYADLAEIVNTVKPVLAKYGLALIQIPGLVVLEPKFEGQEPTFVATVQTIMVHQSGEYLGAMPAGAPLAKDDPQGVGSATTYLRRYSAAAFLFMAQEDDDANAASGKKAPAAKVVAPKKDETGPKPTVEDVIAAFMSVAGPGDMETFKAAAAMGKKLAPADQKTAESAFLAAKTKVEGK